MERSNKLIPITTYIWCLPTEGCNPVRSYSWHVTTHSQFAGMSAFPVKTTRNDKTKNHHPSHSKPATPSVSAWAISPPSHKHNPFFHSRAPPIAVKDLSGPHILRIQLTKSGKQTQTKENKMQTQHMQPFDILVHVLFCPIFNPPFHEGALAPCTQLALLTWSSQASWLQPVCHPFQGNTRLASCNQAGSYDSGLWLRNITPRTLGH